ncbi:hypothetical protein HDU97_008833 [Phlyctochytrium planicorne]|nr:hypothetical protein HDU97_008833 [Phlyctochytrium planicorne]
MNIFKIAFALLQITAVAMSAPSASASEDRLSKRDFCVRYNTNDCREFKLVEIKSADVDKHIIIANPSNTPPQVPSYLHGAFYMKGNPLSDEVVSLANGWYDSKDQAYYVRVYDENVWTWDNTVQGKLLYDSIRTNGLTYRITWNAANITQIEPIFNVPLWLGNGDITVKEWYKNLTMIPTSDPNYFIRKTLDKGQPVDSYQVMKILNADGSRTEKYASEYLERIGKGKFQSPPGFINTTHLEESQLIAKLVR